MYRRTRLASGDAGSTRDFTTGPSMRSDRRSANGIERFFSWLKTTAQLRKTRHRGHRKLDWNFTLAAAVYNLTRMATLTA